MSETDDPIRSTLVAAYDSMSSERWDAFVSYCLANRKPTSLLTFTEYLIANREGIGSELSPASGKADDPSSKT